MISLEFCFISQKRNHDARFNTHLLLHFSFGMSNILGLIGGRTAPQHRHSESIYQYIIRDYQLDLWSILVYRAITEYICRRHIYAKGTGNDQFKVWRSLLYRNISDDVSKKNTKEEAQFLWQSIQMFEPVAEYSHKTSYGTAIACDELQLAIVLLWRIISGHIYRKNMRTFYNKGTSIDQVVNVPEVC